MFDVLFTSAEVVVIHASLRDFLDATDAVTIPDPPLKRFDPVIAAVQALSILVFGTAAAQIHWTTDQAFPPPLNAALLAAPATTLLELVAMTLHPSSQMLRAASAQLVTALSTPALSDGSDSVLRLLAHPDGVNPTLRLLATLRGAIVADKLPQHPSLRTPDGRHRLAGV